MKKITAAVAILGFAAFMTAGCSNKEAVKPVEQPQATAKAEPVVQPAKPVEAPKQMDHSQPKAEAPKAVEQQAAKASAAEANFETIYFDFDKSDLREDARKVLSKNAEAIAAKSDSKVKIEGHCDERGSAEYNIALGERRAKSALQYLLTLGVKADRVSTVSYGKEKPAVQGNNEDAWAKNRRAEFVVEK